ncbi:MAG: hypothetical protein JXA30_11265 [Deltaproteobacteria bacterium]|nr:hypothetical protein [Deltaproteobacteria bacterium]
MRTVKSVWSILVSLLALSLLLFALGCGGDSDEDTNGSGGAPPDTSGSGGDSSGSGGGGASGSDGMDSGQIDEPTGGTGAETLPTVGAGEQCTMPYSIAGMITLFTAYGVCQNATDECVGGTPDKFDLASIMPAGSETIAGLLPAPPSASANCESGLVCCINTDQCESVGKEIGAGMVGMIVPGITASCKPEGNCAATNTGDSAGELPTGCPSGQICCIIIPPIQLEGGIPELEGGLPEAGTEETTEGGAQTPDAGA